MSLKIPPNLKIRGKLIRLLKGYVEGRGITQEEVSWELGTSQARVSDIVNQRVSDFTIDALINMAEEAKINWSFGPGTSVCSCDSPETELVRRAREDQPTRFAIHCMGCGRTGPLGSDRKEAMYLWLSYLD